jgi:hypothetical protein
VSKRAKVEKCFVSRGGIRCPNGVRKRATDDDLLPLSEEEKGVLLKLCSYHARRIFTRDFIVLVVEGSGFSESRRVGPFLVGCEDHKTPTFGCPKCIKRRGRV